MTSRDASFFTDRHGRVAVRVRVFADETEDGSKGWLYAYGPGPITMLVAMMDIEEIPFSHEAWQHFMGTPGASNSERPITGRYVRT